MSAPFLVFVVDDDPQVLEVMRKVLEPDCVVEAFVDAESSLQRMDAIRPDLLLLDVRMPGMGGYALCRHLKDDSSLKNVPVIFVSSQDSIEARLTGYDAGGEDFVIKPFELEEIRRKVERARRVEESRLAMKNCLADAEQLSALVMENMDEYAILIRYIRELIGWRSEHEIAQGTLEMLRRYRLEGVVQTRIQQRVLTASLQGSNNPLEESVMNHVCGLERIFEFRNRSVYNFECMTLMVRNMPVHDLDYCGRLRDHLCIAAECADARLQSIALEESNQRSQNGIHAVLEQLHFMANLLGQRHHDDRAAGSDLLFRMEQGMARAFIHLGLPEDQERKFGDLMNGYMKEFMDLLDRGEETNGLMEKLREQLGALVVAPQTGSAGRILS